MRAQPSTLPIPDQPSNRMLELRVKQAFDPEPPLRQNEPPREPVWRGLIDVTLKNISRGTVRIEDGGITYQFSVLDSSGLPVPLTEYGKRSRGPSKAHRLSQGQYQSSIWHPDANSPNKCIFQSSIKYNPGRLTRSS
jgi:hypothetical protein